MTKRPPNSFILYTLLHCASIHVIEQLLNINSPAETTLPYILILVPAHMSYFTGTTTEFQSIGAATQKTLSVAYSS